MEEIVAREAGAIAKREARLARLKARSGMERRGTIQLAGLDLDFFGYGPQPPHCTIAHAVCVAACLTGVPSQPGTP